MTEGWSTGAIGRQMGTAVFAAAVVPMYIAVAAATVLCIGVLNARFDGKGKLEWFLYERDSLPLALEKRRLQLVQARSEREGLDEALMMHRVVEMTEQKKLELVLDSLTPLILARQNLKAEEKRVLPDDTLKLWRERDQAEITLMKASSEVQKIGVARNENATYQETLRAEINSFEQKQAKLNSENGVYLSQVNFYGHELVRPLASIPYDALVLITTILAGAVGGILLVTKWFWQQGGNPDFKEFIFRPLIGAIVAIGSFVLAKAGFLVFSPGADAQALNPFAALFIGLLSGLLAKEVIEVFESKGRDLLSRGSNKENGGPGGATGGGAGTAALPAGAGGAARPAPAGS